MTHAETYQVRAQYHGHVDLGAPCFSIPLTDIKPKSVCRNRIFCRSRIGDGFVIGNSYDVVLNVTTDGKRDFEVVATI